MSLRAAVAKGRTVRLQESNKTGELDQPGETEAKAFRRLAFKRQVSSEVYSGTFKRGHCGSICTESLLNVILALVIKHSRLEPGN